MAATLPPDTLTHIFQYPTFNEMIWCGLVCKDWLAATNYNIFWAKLPPHYQSSERKSKRLLYIEWTKHVDARECARGSVKCWCRCTLENLAMRSEEIEVFNKLSK
jgi:hypothetical protein